jgi:hypothetical protein
MPRVVKHAWTHRPRSQGGTDPIEVGGGDLPWIRLKRLSGTNQTVPDSGTTADTVLFDTVVNNYPATFDTSNFGGQPSIINILEGGLYIATVRLYCTAVPTLGYELGISGVDWDEWATYSTYVPQFFFSSGVGQGYGEVTFRSGPTFGDTPPSLQIDVSNPGTGNLTISKSGGTYFEIRQISPNITLTGVDSNSPA